MSENEKSGGVVAAIANAFAAWKGTLFPIYLGLAFMALALRWDGHLHDQKGCFQLQEVKDVVYKVNTCSGEVEELKIENLQSKIVSQATASTSRDPKSMAKEGR